MSLSNPEYAVLINNDMLRLVTFLNDGIPPILDKEAGSKAYLICEFNGPREITAKVMYEDELYDEDGSSKEYMIHVIG